MKKFLAVLLAAILVALGVVVAGAAEGTAEEAPHEFNFDAKSAGWEDAEYISFHIWGDDEIFFDWGSRRQKGKDDDGDGIWTYDLDSQGIVLDPDKNYYVICYSSTGDQTYNLIAGVECFGDTVYLDGTQTENPVDSSKKTYTAYWKNQDPAVYGPQLAITSIGNVVGTCLPKGQTGYSLMVAFFKNYYTNALGCLEKNGYKDSQEMVDTIGTKLGLTKDGVEAAIKESEVDVEWDKSKSTIADKATPDEATPDEATPDEPKPKDPVLGDADRDGVLSVTDVTRIQEYLAELIEEEEIDLTVSDTNHDGYVSILDATHIQMFLAHLIKEM